MPKVAGNRLEQERRTFGVRSDAKTRVTGGSLGREGYYQNVPILGTCRSDLRPHFGDAPKRPSTKPLKSHMQQQVSVFCSVQKAADMFALFADLESPVTQQERPSLRNRHRVGYEGHSSAPVTIRVTPLSATVSPTIKEVLVCPVCNMCKISYSAP